MVQLAFIFAFGNGANNIPYVGRELYLLEQA